MTQFTLILVEVQVRVKSRATVAPKAASQREVQQIEWSTDNLLYRLKSES